MDVADDLPRPATRPSSCSTARTSTGRLDVAFRIAAELGLGDSSPGPVGLSCPGLSLDRATSGSRSGGRAAWRLPILDVGDDLDGGVAGMILPDR